ncbi:MAG: response regulator [Pirellulales bacterium]|nr:response regulator [Pirellulales bacterium]
MEVALDPLRILVADDTATNARLAAQVFRERGHQVGIVPDGRDAVTSVAAQPCDVVLMDIHMPDLDGPAATTAIRTSGHGQAMRIPIVGISAFTTLGDRRRYLLSGMDAFLLRPVEVDHLVQVVEGMGMALRSRSDGTGRGEASATKAHPTSTADVMGADGPVALLRCGGDCDLFRQMVAAFEQRADSLLAEIRDGIVAQQPATVRAATLTLARLAATSAADGLLEKCHGLVAATEAASLRGLAKHSSGLSGEIAHAARELGCFSATLSSDSISAPL